MVTARCMKCREKKEVKEPRQITMKNGRPAIKGVCFDCGTTMFRIGKLESKDGTDVPEKEQKKDEANVPDIEKSSKDETVVAGIGNKDD